MFTGIIKSLGKIHNINEKNSNLNIEIFVSDNIYNTTNIGDSVSVNGVCLTAVNKDKNILFFDIVNETLQKTNLKFLKLSENINLETPLKMSDGLDGHIVQGHIDTTGIIAKNELEKDNWMLEVKIKKKWMKYCISKGSIAIDGISLTIAKINEVYDETFGSISVSIIPHTLDNTNLKYKNKKDTVNIETDFFAKYVEKLLPKKD
jgi:riboflavin synthase